MAVERDASGKRPPRRPGSPAPPARRYNATDTRARLLEAAYQLFYERGHVAAGTAEIAAEAGVSEGSIFYHFGSKPALLAELGRLHGQRMIEAMRGDDEEGVPAIETSLDRCFEFNATNRPPGAGGPAASPASSAPAADSSPPPGPMQEGSPFFEGMRQVVVSWIMRQAELQADRLSPRLDIGVAAPLLFAVVSAAMGQYFAPEKSDDERRRIRAECIRFCGAAVGSRP